MRHHTCIQLLLKMPAPRVVKRFWAMGDRRCLLCVEEEFFELRLYDKGKLVGLWPCDTIGQAFDLATAWLDTPPQWPPY